MEKEICKKKPRVAVVLPVYNLEKYLEECLDSLLRQSYSNYVVLAVDDGSSDKSGEILDRYASRTKRLKVIHKKNSGVAAARNEALDKIEKDGSFAGICFVDADDKVKDNFISNFVNLSLKYDADYVVTAWDMFDKTGLCNVPRTKIPRHADKVMDCDECFQHFLRFGAWKGVKSKTYSLFCLNVYFSAETVKGLRFKTSLKRTEDQDYRVRAMSLVRRGVVNSDVNYLYRLRISSLSHRNNDFMDDVLFPIGLMRNRGKVPASGIFAIEQLLLKGWWRCVCAAINSGDFARRRKQIDGIYEKIKGLDFHSPIIKKFRFKLFVYSLGYPGLKLYMFFRKERPLHDLSKAYE